MDCTTNVKICSEFEVTGYPTLLYMRAGNVYARYDGARDVTTLKEFIEQQAASVAPDTGEEGRIADAETAEVFIHFFSLYKILGFLWDWVI